MIFKVTYFEKIRQYTKKLVSNKTVQVCFTK